MSVCSGCGKKDKGVKIEPGNTSKEADAQATTAFGVDNLSKLLTNGPDGDPGKRLSAAKRAGRMASRPDLTADMKQKLIEALNKMIMNEPMSEADDMTKTEIIEEGKKSLQTLQGG
jgi:hypothetical protein